MSRQHLIFKRATETFAIQMDEMIEVLRIETVRPIPLSDPALAGYTAIRDLLLPVFDPLLLLALRPHATPATATTYGILAGTGRARLIILSDEIGRVLNLDENGPQNLSTARTPAAFARTLALENRPPIHILAIEKFAASLALD